MLGWCAVSVLQGGGCGGSGRSENAGVLVLGKHGAGPFICLTVFDK